MTVDDIQRLHVRTELPEIDEISDTTLATKVVEAWALALSQSSFESIADIPASGNPDTPPIKTGTQTDHIRGVTRLAIAEGSRVRFPAPTTHTSRKKKRHEERRAQEGTGIGKVT